MAGITDVLRNLGSLLASAGVGTYSESQAVNTGTVISLKKVPQSPDRAVVLNIVIQGQTRDIDSTDVYLDAMIQVRCRGGINSPTDPDDMAEAVANVLNGLSRYTAGAYTIVSLARQTHIQNGQDDSGRYEVLSQFYGQITAH